MIKHTRAAAELLNNEMMNSEWGITLKGNTKLNVLPLTLQILIENYLASIGYPINESLILNRNNGNFDYILRKNNETVDSGVVDDYFLRPPLAKLSVIPENLTPAVDDVLTIEIELSRWKETGIDVTIDSNIHQLWGFFRMDQIMLWSCDNLRINSSESGFTIRMRERTATIAIPWIKSIVDFNMAFYLRIMEGTVMPDYPDDVKVVTVRNVYDLTTRTLEEQPIINGFKWVCKFQADIGLWFMETRHEDGRTYDDYRVGLSIDEFLTAILKSANKQSGLNLEMIPRRIYNDTISRPKGYLEAYSHSYAVRSPNPEYGPIGEDAFYMASQFIQDRRGWIAPDRPTTTTYEYLRFSMNNIMLDGHVYQDSRFKVNAGTDSEYLEVNSDRIGYRFVLRESLGTELVNLPN